MRLSLVTIVFRTESELLPSTVGRVFSTSQNRQSRAACALGMFLQRIRLVLSETENVVIPPPAQKTFDAEGEILEHALTKSFRLRNEAMKSLRTSVLR